MDYKSPFESEQSSQFDNFELHVNAEAQSFLRETAKWATFLSILGYVYIGLMVLGAFFMMALGSDLDRSGAVGGMFVGILYLVFAVLFFFPVLYLNRFAGKMKDALNSNRTDLLTDSFGNLKSHYKFVGILTIISIAVFILFFVIVIVAGMSAAAGAF